VRAVVRCARASGVAASRERRVAKKTNVSWGRNCRNAHVSRKKEAEEMLGVSVVFFCERSRQT